ncbi:MAG: hypothetical protein INR71_03535 [Terriglobus roseus]|nr:hypothetical protein [Terriglobus roseus]
MAFTVTSSIRDQLLTGGLLDPDSVSGYDSAAFYRYYRDALAFTPESLLQEPVVALLITHDFDPAACTLVYLLAVLAVGLSLYLHLA